MIRNILVTFSARIAVAAANFIVLLCTTHELGADVRGKISMIQLGIQLIHLISDMAGGPSMVYLVPRSQLRKLVISATVWAVFSAAVVGSLLLYFGQIPQAYGADILGIGLLVSLSAVFQNILLGQERIRDYNMLLLTQGALLIGGVVFSLYAAGVHSEKVFVYGSYLSWSVVAVAAAYLVLSRKHEAKQHESRPMLMVLFANGFFTQAATLTHQLSIRENYFRLEKLSSENDS
ncbi:MAG: lipopolysaccharide biosynthesis protein, partial [Bacteroidia bacterium]